MLTVKSQWSPPKPMSSGPQQQNNDFRDVEVRRLHSRLIDMQELSGQANRTMEELISGGHLGVTVDEVREMLNHELTQIQQLVGTLI